MRMPPLKLHRFTRVEYERLVERGAFGPDDRVELLDGLLVVREPQGSRHATAVLKVRRALERAFGRRFHVRDQLPVALDEASEPEPDLAVIRGRIEDYRDAHPSDPVLVVEVADASLARDRLRKSAIYARAGVADYWVVNLVNEVLEVYRQPTRVTASRWKYGRVQLVRADASVVPLGAPGARVRVADLLP
jgi:Uma2 family endonuclease